MVALPNRWTRGQPSSLGRRGRSRAEGRACQTRGRDAPWTSHCVVDMPILSAETSLFPECLFEDPRSGGGAGYTWWVFHTKPRQEKSLARHLHEKLIPFYLPL